MARKWNIDNGETAKLPLLTPRKEGVKQGKAGHLVMPKHTLLDIEGNGEQGIPP